MSLYDLCALFCSADFPIYRLTVWRSYSYWRQEVTTPIMTILFRDGIIYFGSAFVPPVPHPSLSDIVTHINSYLCVRLSPFGVINIQLTLCDIL